MKKKFAFMLMGGHYIPEVHNATFETEKQVTYIVTVRNFDEACEKIRELKADGVGVVELCGAFGEAGAQKLIELTGHELPIGYIVHQPEQDELFDLFFG